MIKGSRRKKAVLGFLLMLIPYLITIQLLYNVGIMERSLLGDVMVLLVIVIVLQWGLVMWGVWKGAYWTGGKAIGLFFLHNLKVGGILIALSLEIPWFLLTASLSLFLSYYGFLHLAKIEKSHWKPRPKWWKRIIRIDTIPNALLLICIVEFFLIVSGLRPGEIFPLNYFERVDVLIEKKDYSNNEDGIMAINSEGQHLAATGYWEGKFKEAYGMDSTFSGSVHSVFRHYRDLREGDDSTLYSKMVDSLKLLPDSLLDPVDSALIQTLATPINADGFRSIAFKPYQTEKKKVLLLGDSFTFGWSADGWTNSFADLLSTLGYVVYNSGISGTDPAQYLAVARRYVPLLQPDVVITNIYLGNDIVYYTREVSGNQPVYFVTNAGVLMACPTKECFPSAEKAYDFCLREQYLAVDPNAGADEKFLSRSIIGTALWKGLKHLGILRKAGMGPNDEYWKRNSKDESEKPLTENYLLAIQALCDSFNIPSFTSVIPTNNNPRPDLKEEYPGLFEVIQPFIPELTENDFESRKDGHYNNQGHLKHALFLDSLVRSLPGP